MEVLQSRLSEYKGQAKNEDSSEKSHSTGTASKAAGERYGSAKGATLVVFKMFDTSIFEVLTSFEQGISSKP